MHVSFVHEALTLHFLALAITQKVGKLKAHIMAARLKRSEASKGNGIKIRDRR